MKLGTVTLEVPVLLAMARNQLAVLEAELGRGVCHVEAVANRELPLDSMVRMIVDDWVRGLFRRLDEIAPALLPTDLASAIAAPPKAGPLPAAVRRGAKINRTDL